MGRSKCWRKAVNPRGRTASVAASRACHARVETVREFDAAEHDRREIPAEFEVFLEPPGALPALA